MFLFFCFVSFMNLWLSQDWIFLDGSFKRLRIREKKEQQVLDNNVGTVHICYFGSSLRVLPSRYRKIFKRRVFHAIFSWNLIQDKICFWKLSKQFVDRWALTLNLNIFMVTKFINICVNVRINKHTQISTLWTRWEKNT